MSTHFKISRCAVPPRLPGKVLLFLAVNSLMLLLFITNVLDVNIVFIITCCFVNMYIICDGGDK